MNHSDAIKQYITNEIINNKNITLNDDDELLLSGLIDSLSVVRLIAYIEEKIGSPIPPEDVTLENFQTVRAIANYLNSLGSNTNSSDQPVTDLSI
jgi:acyl carrier protein